MNIEGAVLLDRALARHEVWDAPFMRPPSEPFCKRAAWIDLLLLANTSEANFCKRGREVDLARGQVGWSKKGLADRWGWSHTKTTAWLAWLEQRGMVRVESVDKLTTIITLTNYGLYQGAIEALAKLSAEEPEAHGKSTERVPGENGESTERDRGGIGEGEGSTKTPRREGMGGGEAPTQEPRRRNSPELAEAVRWFAASGSGYDAKLVEAVWHSFEATKIAGDWYRGKALVSDWRSAMAERLVERLQQWEKNSAPRAGEGEKPAGPPPMEAGVPGSAKALAELLSGEDT